MEQSKDMPPIRSDLVTHITATSSPNPLNFVIPNGLCPEESAVLPGTNARQALNYFYILVCFYGQVAAICFIAVTFM